MSPPASSRLAALGLVLLLAACSQTTITGEQSKGGPKPLDVEVTISTFETFARAVGGDRILVTSLVPVGASPEDYQPSPADIEKLHAADVLIENGVGLESWLARTIDNAKNPALDVVVATRGLPVKDGNPHLWMDPEFARSYVRTIRDALIARDPAGKSAYLRNAAGYDKDLVALEQEIAAKIRTIPPASRSMIVFHNAWQYYDDRFGLRTIGVIELSPGQEPNPQYISKLIGLAKVNHVRAVFAEPEYSPKLVDALAQSAGISTVENLYDDSIGSDPHVRTYDDMLRYDTATIVKALGGSAT
jgi:manganese/iron transport system substrate-binding protein